MSLTAEEVFDSLNTRYEDAYINNPDLISVIEVALGSLKPQSTILDVGCGTGKPVAAMFAAAGHKVIGIDVSQNMVDIANTQVPGGEFQKADMRTFNPERQFDAVVAAYSMYQMNPTEAHAMVCKFAEWLKVDGILVLGSTPSTNIPRDFGEYDDIWDCIRARGMIWMGHRVDEIFFSEKKWKDLLQSAGLVIIYDALFKYDCHPDTNDLVKTRTETHFFMVAKRSCKLSAFLGPHPIPATRPGPFRLDQGCFQRLSERSDLTQLKCLVSDSSLLIQNRGTAPGADSNSFMTEILSPSSPTQSSIVDDLSEVSSLPSGPFDSVVSIWILDHVKSIHKAISTMIQVIDRGAPNPRIAILQGAPWNDVVMFENAICAPFAKNNHASHQGYLLNRAIEVLSEHGFQHFTLKVVPLSCHLSGATFSEQADAAAEILGGLWHRGDPCEEKMKQALIPHLGMHLRDTPQSIGFDMVMLEASLAPSGR